MSVTKIEIVLELDVADCPSGTAAAPGREPQAFHGWLELVWAIADLSQPNGHEAGGFPGAPTPSTQGELR